MTSLRDIGEKTQRNQESQACSYVGKSIPGRRNSKWKVGEGLGKRMCLACWMNRKETSMAGAEYGTGE